MPHSSILLLSVRVPWFNSFSTARRIPFEYSGKILRNVSTQPFPSQRKKVVGYTRSKGVRQQNDVEGMNEHNTKTY